MFKEKGYCKFNLGPKVEVRMLLDMELSCGERFEVDGRIDILPQPSQSDDNYFIRTAADRASRQGLPNFHLGP